MQKIYLDLGFLKSNLQKEKKKQQMCDNYILMIQIKIEKIVSLADTMFLLSGYKFKHVVRQE